MNLRCIASAVLLSATLATTATSPVVAEKDKKSPKVALPANSLLGRYRTAPETSSYRQQGNIKIPVSVSFKEYEIKPKGRYTEHFHMSKAVLGVNGEPRPKSKRNFTYTINADGSSTSSATGTYTLSRNEITFAREIMPYNPRKPFRVTKGFFVKDGYVYMTRTGRFENGKLLFKKSRLHPNGQVFIKKPPTLRSRAGL